jgi:Uma2 family endonuclease
MKAVMVEVPEHLLAWRKSTGADRWDEIWDGTLHMPPAPTREHQDFVDALKIWLELFWAAPEGNRVHREVNLAAEGGWPDRDFRIPDLILLTPDRFGIDRNEYFEGAPLVVVEVHSPGDETYDKFDFYAKLNVPELWTIHRETKAPEVYVLQGSRYRREQPGDEGWTRSPCTGVLLRRRSDRALDIQRENQPDTRRARSHARSAF